MSYTKLFEQKGGRFRHHVAANAERVAQKRA